MAKYEANEALILATALDQQFKLEWCGDSKKKQEIEKLLNVKSSTIGLSPPEGLGGGGLSRECVLRIPSVIVKGD